MEAADKVPQSAAVQAIDSEDKLQTTPWLLLSFATVAVNAIVLAACNETDVGDTTTEIAPVGEEGPDGELLGVDAQPERIANANTNNRAKKLLALRETLARELGLKAELS